MGLPPDAQMGPERIFDSPKHEMSPRAVNCFLTVMQMAESTMYKMKVTQFEKKKGAFLQFALILM